MKRRTFFMCLAGTAAAGLTGLSLNRTGFSGNASGPLLKVTRRSRALGADVHLTVFHRHPRTAEQAIDEAFAELERVESIMSLHRPDSQICELNRTGHLQAAHPDLVEVLTLANELGGKTGGAFDITVQPLWKVYTSAGQAGRLPSEEELQTVLGRVDWRRVKVEGRTVRLEGTGTEITLNGIAQGFAADAVGRVLSSRGIHHALIDTGEINALGHHADKDAWTIGIKHPRAPQDFLALASLNGRSLATSGDYETRFSEDFRHHHLLDPRTGRSPVELASVSIAAPSAMEADAWSTAVFLMGREKGRALVEATPGLDALFVTKEGQFEKTAGFPTV